MFKWMKKLKPNKKAKADKAHRLAMLKEKDAATEAGEAWVTVLNMETDGDDISRGNFELDWNDKFVADLARAGFAGKTQEEMVDQWFTTVCRHIVLETYEQEEADAHPTKSTNLKDGRREYR